MLPDVELLRIDNATQWTSDDRCRLVLSRRSDRVDRAPHLVIAQGRDGRVVAFGSSVPDALANELRAAVDAEILPDDTAIEPAALPACELMLSHLLGSVTRSSGPAWVIESAPRFSCEGAVIVTSNDIERPRFATAVPAGFTWEADEWHDLMTGELGPWAMCTIDGAPASLCHCSRIADAGVAAGLWTHPDYRRHGYGAAATAAWAAIALQEWQHVFYSTNAGNRSSERVAERLGLRPIGWRWMLSPAISS